MQIAISGVEDIRNLELVAVADVADLDENFRQFPKRDRPVHTIVIGDAPDSAERRFAPKPNGGAFSLALAHLYSRRLEGLRDLLDAAQQVVHLFIGAFHFDDEQRADVQRISSLCETLADFNCGFVHKLDGDRNDAGRDDR